MTERTISASVVAPRAAEADDAHALHGQGALHFEQGDPSGALELISAAIAADPHQPEFHNNLGQVLATLGRAAEAKGAFCEAIRQRPNFPEAFRNLGNVLRELGCFAEAEASYAEALRLRPDFADAYCNLGVTLSMLGRFAEAETSFAEALRLRPDLAEAHSNLGITLGLLGQFADAERCHVEALRLRPDIAEAHCNLGAALLAQGRVRDAEQSFGTAVHLRPDLAAARYNLAEAHLLMGRFEEGWQEFEARQYVKQFSGAVSAFPQPQWIGEPIGDRVILLHAECGFGDTIQFCRFVPLVGRNAKVVLDVPGPLVRLLSWLDGIDELVIRGDPLPAFDVHCPLMSLPLAFGTSLDTIPADIPYLSADPELAAPWRERLANIDGIRVGIAWAGGLRPGDQAFVATDRRRSIALTALAPLAEVAGVNFFSLQKGEPAAQALAPPPGMTVHDFTADLTDFADTAALIDCLDLVISVDTAVAHLAGAMGKPVWLLNRFDTCWRWLLDRDDSPWYRTLRQFRQPAPGEWDRPIGAVRDALRRLAAGDRNQLVP